MSTVTINLKGGTRLAKKLSALERKVTSAKTVRIGFLEGQKYPASDGGARLAARAATAEKDGHPQWQSRLSAWASWEATHQRDLSIAQVAFWNEFGTTTQKPRPFFRTTISAHSGEWGDALKGYFQASGFNAKIALTTLGIRIKDEIVATIAAWPADNRPLTEYIKGFNHGLIDRGTMQRHVDMEVT